MTLNGINLRESERISEVFNSLDILKNNRLKRNFAFYGVLLMQPLYRRYRHRRINYNATVVLIHLFKYSLCNRDRCNLILTITTASPNKNVNNVKLISPGRAIFLISAERIDLFCALFCEETSSIL